jgi:hypothetical protein
MKYLAILMLFLVNLIYGCGDKSNNETVNNYQSSTITITLRTMDQFKNPVPALISHNGTQLGTKKVQLTYNPSKGGRLTFSELSAYTAPSQVDLSTVKFEDGQIVEFTYVRVGSAINVCPHAVSSANLPVNTEIFVNSVSVDYQAGNCWAVDSTQNINIVGRDMPDGYAIPIYIPGGKLKAGQTYHYDLRYVGNGKQIYVVPTPVSGEVFLNGKSLGWSNSEDKSITVLLHNKEEGKLSFGEVAGHQVAKPFTVKASSVDPYKEETLHFWALYDYPTHALTCFTGINASSNNKDITKAKVFIDNNPTRLITGYSYPGCLGLKTSTSYTAVFEAVNNYQSDDKLSISKASHVGCEGNFIPGGRLDCIGKYYYVQPAVERTDYLIQVNFISTYQGKTDYPVLGYYKKDGLNKEQYDLSFALKIGESVSLDFLPIGILQPSLSKLVVDASKLSETAPEFSSEQNRWIYTVNYQPPADATEVCIKAYNQNDEDITKQLSFQFDGINQLNSYAENLSCQWVNPADSHQVTSYGLNGYWSSVFQVYIPAGLLTPGQIFGLPFAPNSNRHRLCVIGFPVEAPLTLNGYKMGWSNIGDKCFDLDKSRANTLTIEGKSTRNYIAQDPSLMGEFSTIAYENFLTEGLTVT